MFLHFLDCLDCRRQNLLEWRVLSNMTEAAIARMSLGLRRREKKLMDGDDDSIPRILLDRCRRKKNKERPVSIGSGGGSSRDLRGIPQGELDGLAVDAAVCDVVFKYRGVLREVRGWWERVGGHVRIPRGKRRLVVERAEGGGGRDLLWGTRRA